MMKQTLLCLVVVSIAGCVFGGEDPPIGNEDAGENNQNNENNRADMTVADAAMDVGNNEVPDMRMPPDEGRPDEGVPDLGMPDEGMPDMNVDMGVDMPPMPMPFLIEAEHVIALGGMASLAEPTEVAELATGFLIGYADGLADRAIFGWYSSDSANVLDSVDYPTDLLPVNVASTSVGGFGIFFSSTEYYIAHFSPTAVGAPSLGANLITESATSTTKRELATGVEADDVYVLLNSIFTSTNQPRVELNTADDVGWGYASTAALDNFNMSHLDLTGGERGIGRRLLGAGVVAGNYVLNDYNFDINVNPFWSIDQHTCGGATADPRIVPVGNAWALVEAPDAAGATLDAVECVPLGNPVVNRTTLIQPMDAITDFAVAKEDLVVGSSFGVAWVDGDVPMFGIATMNGNGTFGIGRMMRLPGRAQRIRAAFNPTRSQWGVAITTNMGSRLVILETNPNF